jgi:hypothetical protein
MKQHGIAIRESQDEGGKRHLVAACCACEWTIESQDPAVVNQEGNEHADTEDDAPVTP